MFALIKLPKCLVEISSICDVSFKNLGSQIFVLSGVFGSSFGHGEDSLKHTLQRNQLRRYIVNIVPTTTTYTNSHFMASTTRCVFNPERPSPFKSYRSSRFNMCKSTGPEVGARVVYTFLPLNVPSRAGWTITL